MSENKQYLTPEIFDDGDDFFEEESKTLSKGQEEIDEDFDDFTESLKKDKDFFSVPEINFESDEKVDEIDEKQEEDEEDDDVFPELNQEGKLDKKALLLLSLLSFKEKMTKLKSKMFKSKKKNSDTEGEENEKKTLKDIFTRRNILTFFVILFCITLTIGIVKVYILDNILKSNDKSPTDIEETAVPNENTTDVSSVNNSEKNPLFRIMEFSENRMFEFVEANTVAHDYQVSYRMLEVDASKYVTELKKAIYLRNESYKKLLEAEETYLELDYYDLFLALNSYAKFTKERDDKVLALLEKKENRTFIKTEMESTYEEESKLAVAVQDEIISVLSKNGVEYKVLEKLMYEKYFVGLKKIKYDVPEFLN